MKQLFILSIIEKAIRAPKLLFRMINMRRIKNTFLVIRTEGLAGVQKHFRAIEEYEWSRSAEPESNPWDIQELAPADPSAGQIRNVELPSVDASVEQVGNVELPPANVSSGQIQTVELPSSPEPLVSIIIPVYNNFPYTYACLASIARHCGKDSFEVLVADDCSTDDTEDRIRVCVRGIRWIRTPKNVGFLKNCNHAAKEAKGRYILFLNNDTQVQEGWLSSLVELMERDESIGMAGSKLVYPDGRLQEAGGIIWDDGSAYLYGHGGNPLDCEYNYVKEVDYISGASIMIRRELWQEIGGFDERYAPAYYEDSDLAFAVRRAGKKVVYQPASVVIHFEGISNGTSVTSGVKKYQVRNRKRFYEKWKSILRAEQCAAADGSDLARDRSQNRKRMLIIDVDVPNYDKDAGSRTTYMYVKLFLQHGYFLTYFGDRLYRTLPYAQELEQMGVAVIYGTKYIDHKKSWLKEHLQYFDIVLLNRPFVAMQYVDLVKKYAKGKILFFGHDLHYKRTMRQYKVSGNKAYLKESRDWKKKEYHILAKSDMSYYFSKEEVNEVHRNYPKLPVKPILLYFFDKKSLQETSFNYCKDNREGLLFVGGFAHSPNVDAIRWFMRKIYPAVAKKLSVNVYVVGAKPPEDVTVLASDQIHILGSVEEEKLQELYRTCRIAVVPLRFGAGVKGKVVEAWQKGLPLVTTPIGVQGLEGAEGFTGICHDAVAFAKKIIDIYEDEETLRRMSEKGLEHVRSHFTAEAAWERIEGDLR